MFIYQFNRAIKKTTFTLPVRFAYSTHT